MSEHTCSHIGCLETDDSCTMYKEPTEHNERGWFPVCGKHADFSKDDIQAIVDGAASEMSAHLLASLKGRGSHP